jgi:uncharacterized protein (TIGR02145 family)
MMYLLNAKIQIGLVFIIFCIIGCKKIEPEKTFDITTDDVELYAEGIYTFKGTIVSLGKEKINEHGFYWSESTNPEIDGISIRLGSKNDTGRFSSSVYNILPGTTYYVRAFAATNSFYYYGDEKSFTTPDTIVHPVIDVDNNIYYPVKIGDQMWMSENLKTSHYSDGSIIQRIDDQLVWFNLPGYANAYCWYENYGALAATYGNLYTWTAAVNIYPGDDIPTGIVQGVCPDGWHLPSDDEWKQLEMFLGMSQAEVDGEKWRGKDEGGMMKSEGTHSWEIPNTGATDESGFRALPAGLRNGAGYFKNIGKSTRFWSSSITGDFVWIRQLDYNSSRIYRSTNGVYEGNSVRCIKNKK